MATIEQILDRAGQIAVSDIRKSFNEKNLNDTKKARDSISYQVNGDTLIITGLARVLFLEFGRRHGEMPPIDPIKKWVESKLGVSKEESRGVAFAIAKKIAKKGTDILTDRAKGLEIELTIAMINNLLLKEITNQLTLEITGGLAALWGSGKKLNILE